MPTPVPPITWLWLVLAILFEVAWALSLKASQGFTRIPMAIATVVTYALSLVFLMLAVKRLDVGTTYAIWAGSGAALIAVAGIVWFKEPAGALKLVSLALVIAGVVGLNLTEGHTPPAPPAPNSK
jgi:multidrug transporter EmrE-like cation transporter